MKVRVGTGNIDEMDVILDAEWEAVPAVGDRVFVDYPKEKTRKLEVVERAFQTSDDGKLIGCLLLVKEGQSVDYNMGFWAT